MKNPRRYCTHEVFDQIAADTKMGEIAQECARLVVVGGFTQEAAAKFCRENFGARAQPSQIGLWAGQVRARLPEPGRRFVSRREWFDRWFEDRLENAGSEGCTWAKELRLDYQVWADKHGAPYVYQVLFQQLLAERGAAREGSRTILRGLRLRSPTEPHRDLGFWTAVDIEDDVAEAQDAARQEQWRKEADAAAAKRTNREELRALSHAAIRDRPSKETWQAAERERRRAVIDAAIAATRESLPDAGIVGFAPTGRIVK